MGSLTDPTMFPSRVLLAALYFPSLSLSFVSPHQQATRASPRLQGALLATTNNNGDAIGRRSALEQGGRVLSSLGFLTSTLALSPLPSVADVSDGNVLPQGAAQLSRVIKVRAQLKSVTKRVAENSSEIDKKEWDEIDNFLRTVYSAGEDMKVMSKGIFDPSKKTKANESIKLLQGLVQLAQKPISNKDATGFGALAQKADGAFEDFFDALSDVPDEI